MNLRDRVREIFLIFPVLSTLILIAEDYPTYTYISSRATMTRFREQFNNAK